MIYSILLLFSIACSKDNEPESQGPDSFDQPGATNSPDQEESNASEMLEAVWRYPDSLPFQNIRYLEFTASELTLYKEHETYGFKDKLTGPYHRTDSTFTFGDVIAYTIIGDSLILPSMSGDVVFVRDTGFLEDQWVSSRSAEEIIVSPINSLGDFDYVNDQIWTGAGEEPGLFLIDPSTEAVVDTLMANYPIDAFEYFIPFQSFYVTPGNNDVFQYDFTFQQSAVFADQANLDTPIKGMAVANGNYAVANDEDITFLDGSGGKFNEVQTDMDLMGLAFDSNGYLYSCTNAYINVCQLDPFLTLATYKVKELDSLGGIAFITGSQFWISGRTNGENNVKLVKISIPTNQ